MMIKILEVTPFLVTQFTCESESQPSNHLSHPKYSLLAAFILPVKDHSPVNPKSGPLP